MKFPFIGAITISLLLIYPASVGAIYTGDPTVKPDAEETAVEIGRQNAAVKEELPNKSEVIYKESGKLEIRQEEVVEEVVTLQSYQTSMLISAYYSPQPNQSRYVRGSYTGDTRLNGQGTHGASGRPVFFGMLAAPKSYAFGTKIYIPGLGVGIVTDRGGAIKGNRLDVWMGYGETGMYNALNWGKRSREVTVYPVGTEVPGDLLALGFGGGYISSNPTVAKSAIPVVRKSLPSLKREDKGEAVRELQKRLTDAGYELPVTGYFGEMTEASLIKFQMEQGVISAATSAGAGYYGPKTRKAMEETLAESEKKIATNEGQIRSNEGQIGTKDVQIGSNEGGNKVEKVAASEKDMREVYGLKIGDEKEEVRLVQERLADLGYLSSELNTGYYGEMTDAAIRQFQLDQGVVTKDSEYLGTYGPKTATALFSQPRIDEIVLGKVLSNNGQG